MEFKLIQIELGAKGNLNQTQAAISALQVANVMANTSPTVGLALYVGGFDDTDVELIDIPEACRFLAWVSVELLAHGVDFDRLMPETQALLRGCYLRMKGRSVIFVETNKTEFWDDFQAWEQGLRQKAH